MALFVNESLSDVFINVIAMSTAKPVAIANCRVLAAAAAAGYLRQQPVLASLKQQCQVVCTGQQGKTDEGFCPEGCH